MSVVSVSSDTQSDEDIHLIPHMDSEPDDDGSTQSPMPVPPCMYKYISRNTNK
jgi:hypothetical protein